jgi:hypothetical protein
MKIFISHIQEEFQIALVLKKWIESSFSEYCEVLVSSDPEDIPTMAQYLEQDQQALLDVKASIVLCSPRSLQKPWISFEAGCAWIRKILVIPICYAGLTPPELPQPLATFPGFDLDQRDFPQKLFMALAKELGLSHLPQVQYRQMRQEIMQVQEAIYPGGFDFTGSRGPGAAPELPLEPHHVQILLVLHQSYGYTSAVLAEHFKKEEKKILSLLERLIEGNYVYASPAGMGHVRYNLTARGKTYLQQNGLI